MGAGRFAGVCGTEFGRCRAVRFADLLMCRFARSSGDGRAGDGWAGDGRAGDGRARTAGQRTVLYTMPPSATGGSPPLRPRRRNGYGARRRPLAYADAAGRRDYNSGHCRRGAFLSRHSQFVVRHSFTIALMPGAPPAGVCQLNTPSQEPILWTPNLLSRPLPNFAG